MLQILFLFLLPYVFGDEGPTLSLPTGTILGHYLTSRSGKRFAAYEGVPYAKPPIGDLRWEPSQPSQPWEGVKNCTVKPPMCTQNNWTDIIQPQGQEDCLYLNLYHPIDQNMTEMPVMVWIHGGGLVAGTGSNYGPEFLMDEGVVVITINYRMGVFGFLSLNSPQYSGNQGLRDQTLALTWVQENLHPGKVTIFGESAGSWSVSHHILSPQSAGLFQAAIGQSGTMDNGLAFPVLSREESFEQGKSFAIAANCFNGSVWNVNMVLDCLKDKTSSELFHIMNNIGFITMGNVDDISEYGPILPDSPDELLKFGLFNQVPVIWGSNQGEGSSWFPDVMENPSLLDSFDASWGYDGPRMMFYRNSDKNGSDFGPHDVEYAKAARQFYFDGVVNGEKLTDFVNLLTDTYFLVSVHDMALAMSDFVPVYQYLLSFRDETSFTFTPGPENLGLGPTHGDDIPYLFRVGKVFAPVDYDNWSQGNMDNSLRMCRMWTNFARGDNPTPADNGLGMTWEKVSRENHMYLDIGEDLVMDMTDQYKLRMAFWDQILNQEKIGEVILI